MAFLGSWKIGCYCPDSFFFFLLAIAGAEVGENYTRRPNRSLLSKALQMHLSELNTSELCTGGGGRDDSTVTGADREGGRGEKRKRQRVIHRCGCPERVHARQRIHTGARTHTHAPPLKANAIEGRITAKSIRTNLREMKWSKSKMKRRDEMEWKRGGRLGFTRAQGLLLSTLWTIRTTAHNDG